MGSGLALAGQIARSVEETDPISSVQRDSWRSPQLNKNKPIMKNKTYLIGVVCVATMAFCLSNGANHTKDAEFTFAFPTCNSIPIHFARQAEYPSNPLFTE
jgi:hypothetical protein